MNKKLFVLLTLALSVILFCPGFAAADSVTVSSSFSYDAAAQTSPQTLTLGSFNTALGTLTGISVEASGSVAAEVQLINFTSEAQAFTNADSSGPFAITGPDNDQLGTLTASTGNISGTASAGPFVISTFSNPANTQSYDWTATITPGDFGSYEGSNSPQFTLAYGPYSSSASFTSGALGVGGDQVGNLTLTITYDYNPAPIPGTLWLFAPGLAGLTGLKRKYRG